MKLKNNPFTKFEDTRPTFASSNPKLILRESRLSFSSGLLSAPLISAARDNPFSLNHSNSSSSITKPNNKGEASRNYSALNWIFINYCQSFPFQIHAKFADLHYPLCRYSPDMAILRAKCA